MSKRICDHISKEGDNIQMFVCLKGRYGNTEAILKSCKQNDIQMTLWFLISSMAEQTNIVTVNGKLEADNFPYCIL